MHYKLNSVYSRIWHLNTNRFLISPWTNDFILFYISWNLSASYSLQFCFASYKIQITDTFLIYLNLSDNKRPVCWTFGHKYPPHLSWLAYHVVSFTHIIALCVTSKLLQSSPLHTSWAILADIWHFPSAQWGISLRALVHFSDFCSPLNHCTLHLSPDNCVTPGLSLHTEIIPAVIYVCYIS